MTDNERNAILEYEKMLQTDDIKKKLSTTYFRGSDKTNHETAVTVLRYIFSEILHWTPQDVYNRASKKLIQDLQITIPYNKLIFPKEMNKKRDYFYMAKILYPDDIKSLNTRDRIIILYQQALKKEAQVPPDYFYDEDGYYRAAVCLQYAITRSAEFENNIDLYEKFNDEKFAWRYLKEKKLDKVCRHLFDESPIKFLHYAMPKGQADPLTYYYLRFMNLAKKEKLDKQWEKAVRKGEKYVENDVST